MDHYKQIQLAKYTPYIFNDNDYGGTSIGQLDYSEQKIDFSCETKPTELTFPFCSVIIPLVDYESNQSVDLSNYSELILNLDFNGTESDTVLVYLQNDELSTNQEIIRRANMSILTPNNEYKSYRLPLEDFHLPSWWVFDHLSLTNDFDPRFDNIKRIQISTGDNRIPRTIEMTIHSIELRGKWLSDIQVYSLIISAWLTFFLVVIFYKIIQLINNQRKASQEVEKLVTINETLEHSAIAKSVFLANMSHEIRTPMNGIYGTLQLLKQNSRLPENLELIDKALFSSKSLLTIINDILDFSKIDAGKLELEITPFNLITTIDSLVSDFRRDASEKDISLRFSYCESTPPTWLGDQVRIKQILMNLISNAIKFTEKGYVDVQLEAYLIDNREGIRLTITDTGIGMTDEAIQRLFERFEQADNSTTRKYGGTGLGMSITYSLIELMNGHIKVSSEVNKGTEFIVELPLQRANESLVENKSDEIIECPNLAGKRILIAEDNKVNLLLLKKMLKKSEATLLEAHNGQQAIEEQQNKHPDLIFMDIQMPELDGKHACQQLRALGVDIPIIAFTANVLQHELNEYQAIGFDDVLAKPLEMEKLYQLLIRHLKTD